MSTRKAALTAAEISIERELIRERARRGLLNFTRYTKPDYEVNWHHRTMARYLNQIVTGELTRLIICMPPRHGKSEMVSVRFPAYLLGRQPKAQIIAASYNATLAAKMNRSVQRVIDSPSYRDLFPDTQLNSKNIRSTSSGSWLRNTDEFEVVDHGGFYRSAGVGGSATGYGATCFVGDTLVDTEWGRLPLRYFYEHPVWPRVWAHDAATKQRRLCAVKAVQKKSVTKVVTLTFRNGSVITCTPEHLLYTERAGYQPADTLGPRIAGKHSSGVAAKVSAVCNRVFAHTILASLEACQRREACILRQSLREQIREAQETLDFRTSLRTLRSAVRAENQGGKILLKGLRQSASRRANEGRRKPGRAFDFKALCGDLRRGFVRAKEACQTARQEPMRSLLGKLRRAFRPAHTPYRRGPDEQHVAQSSDPLLVLSYEGAQIGTTQCTRLDRHSDKVVEVFDIEVDVCGNFIAETIVSKNCGIIDDPVKNRDEANSATYRERNWDWYTSTFYSRLEKNGSILICATRWHEDDLIGRLLRQAKESKEADQWTVLNLPAICEDEGEEDDPRKQGEGLWPNKYSLQRLARMKATIGSRDWVSLYQQRPAPADGDIIKKSWFRFWRELPETIDLLIFSADLNSKETEQSDFTVVQVWARSGVNYYLLSQVRARMGWSKQKVAARRVITEYPDYNAFIIEDASNGPALIEEFRALVPGVVAIPAKGSKLSRLQAVSGLIEGGNVYLPDPTLPENAWVNDLMSEIAVFPNGKNDDQVDALSMALRYIRASHVEFDFTAGIVEKAPFDAELRQVG